MHRQQHPQYNPGTPHPAVMGDEARWLGPRGPSYINQAAQIDQAKQKLIDMFTRKKAYAKKFQDNNKRAGKEARDQMQGTRN